MTDVLPLAKELNEYTVTPGVLGFIVFAVLGVGVWILLKSMSRHLGKIDFEENQGRKDSAEEAATASSAAAS
ncbi:hypothetical protein [Streptomyces sp. NBRC 109706]|uniref:hypothetical protein n=1 Tax=Streptomyces sp. NBRC 109706 TaxID=1550035 RepID=UPI000783EF68|nr:hypothetical protein [Streptomyces sp. NBRC 109706]